MTLLVFQLDMSGNNFKDEQQANIKHKSITLSIFHFDISGNDNKDEQL